VTLSILSDRNRERVRSDYGAETGKADRPEYASRGCGRTWGLDAAPAHARFHRASQKTQQAGRPAVMGLKTAFVLSTLMASS